MELSAALGGFIGLVIVVAISAIVVSLLIWAAVLIWVKGIFPIVNQEQRKEVKYHEKLSNCPACTSNATNGADREAL